MASSHLLLDDEAHLTMCVFKIALKHRPSRRALSPSADRLNIELILDHTDLICVVILHQFEKRNAVQ